MPPPKTRISIIYMRDEGPDNDKIVRYGNNSESEISDLAMWEHHDPEVRHADPRCYFTPPRAQRRQEQDSHPTLCCTSHAVDFPLSLGHPFQDLCRYSVRISLKTLFNCWNSESHGRNDGSVFGLISRFASLVLVDR